ncbi:unnamed protein product [Orchesella dallaii]|uniref:Uncharacterized protein n=1 Tax=Orchesella dallaii TaxID=48710 RepID=A0ABP1RM49_9HEXA
MLPSTNAVCCNSYTPGICADCSDAAGFTDGYVLGSCPAVKGDCNIFGCNCVNGCRQPPVGKKGCAPTAHLHSPRLAKSDKHCWLLDKNEKCNGREFWRSPNNLVYTN